PLWGSGRGPEKGQDARTPGQLGGRAISWEARGFCRFDRLATHRTFEKRFRQQLDARWECRHLGDQDNVRLED
ncbi:MAG: hypothetical protein C4321_04950, partial [Chloroflexota bacterium]